MQDDITRLVKPGSPENRLDPAATPDAIRDQTGFQPKQAGKVDSSEVTVKSTDGLFTFTVRVVKA